MDRDEALREQMASVLLWEDAHAGFDAAVKGIAPRFRGVAPGGMPHSPWQLLEHLRITQRDILDFCVAPKYEEVNCARSSSSRITTPITWDS